MAYKFLVSVSGESSNSTSITTSAVDTTGANLIVVAIASNNASSGDFSDSKSNTWIPLTIYNNAGGDRVQLQYCYNPIVGSGHTFTEADAVAIYPSIAVMAFSGAVSSPFDAENGNTIVTNSILTIQPGTVTPAGPNELFVSGTAFGNTTSDMTIDSGFTRTEFQPGIFANSYGVAIAYKISSGAENPTWTKTGIAYNEEACLATFKAQSNTFRARPGLRPRPFAPGLAR